MNIHRCVCPLQDESVVIIVVHRQIDATCVNDQIPLRILIVRIEANRFLEPSTQHLVFC